MSNVTVSVRMPEHIYDQVKAAAAVSRMTMTDFCARELESAVNNFDFASAVESLKQVKDTSDDVSDDMSDDMTEAELEAAIRREEENDDSHEHEHGHEHGHGYDHM